MMNEFTWHVHNGGHQIVVIPGNHDMDAVMRTSASEADRTQRHEVAWIRPKQSSCRSRRREKRYLPLRKPALFRTFAEVDAEQDSIVNFADRYGLLTDAQKGESLETWQAAIAEMR